MQEKGENYFLRFHVITEVDWSDQTGMGNDFFQLELENVDYDMTSTTMKSGFGYSKVPPWVQTTLDDINLGDMCTVKVHVADFIPTMVSELKFRASIEL